MLNDFIEAEGLQDMVQAAGDLDDAAQKAVKRVFKINCTDTYSSSKNYSIITIVNTFNKGKYNGCSC